jgi:hypothetical protein
MMLKIILIIFILTSALQAEEPLSAIEWLDNSDNKLSDEVTAVKTINEEEQVETPSQKIIAIEKTKLDPINLNGIGIIPSYVANLKKSLWINSDETILSKKIEKLDSSKLSKARTLFKRLLIVETDPPKLDTSKKNKNSIFLLSRIDKLITLGALDEAEALLAKIKPVDKSIFLRLKEVALLTGRINNLCKVIASKPKITEDIPIRIICFSRLGDWNTAAIVLSSASSLQMISPAQEELLMFYLDPDLMEDTVLKNSNINLNPTSFYIGELNGVKSKIDSLPPPYLYNDVNKRHAPLRRKVTAAEKLVHSKGINGSRLFSIYRNNSAAGSGGVWERMVSIQNLDRAIKTKRTILTEAALIRASFAMSKAGLLVPFAEEYASMLNHLQISRINQEFNDSIMQIFSLKGSIPKHWDKYSTSNGKLAMAIALTKGHKLNSFDLEIPNQTIELSASVLNKIFSKDSLGGKNEFTNYGLQGNLILDALQLVSNGIETDPIDLQKSLLLLMEAGQEIFARSLMIEFLIESMQSEKEEYYAS